ncbi:MAG: hypothetical protein R3C19_05480 [Planctomycetaceae bacterium]
MREFRSITRKIVALLSLVTMSLTGCAQFHSGGIRQSAWRAQSAEVTQSTDSVTPASFRRESPACAEFAGCDPQIEVGRPNRFIDGIGWFFGIPEKILLWDSRAENHSVSPQTIRTVEQYLADNGMQDVKIRVNQYSPGAEWKRLTQNKAVSPLWRYTFGAISTLGYTLIPGRLFGGDNYNPYTNTVSIYSDIPTAAVHETAYAVDNSRHKYRGTYGFAQGISGINIWHETQAAHLASDWLRDSDQPFLVAENNRIMPPLYGIRVGGSLGEFVPQVQPLATIGGAVTGHAVSYSRRTSGSGNSFVGGSADTGIRPAGYVNTNRQ